MRSKKFLSAVISFTLSVLLLVCSLTPLTVSAKSVSEMNNELAELGQESAEINSKIGQLKSQQNKSEELKVELQKQVENLEKQIAVCLRYVNQFDSEINAMQTEIAQKSAELESSTASFKQRLRAIAMGRSTEMAILLSSDDFADFLAKSKLTQSISAYDQTLMEKIKTNINEIDTDKKDMEKKKSEQQSIKQTLASKQQELKSKVSSENIKINNLDNQTDDLKARLKKIKEAQAQYEAEIAEAIRKAQQSNSVIYDGSQFAWPVKNFYKISSPYGWRTDPFDPSAKEFHKGIDIAGSGIGGQPVLAAANGIATTAGYNPYGYGNYVVINHGKLNGVLYTTHYAHLRSIAVAPGAAVVKGVTVIGYVGTTGSSTGNHLHFEVRLNGSTVNPMNYYNIVK